MSSSELCMVVFLGINTWTDIRKREICLPVFLLFLAGGILWRIKVGTVYPEGILSLGIGVVAAIASVLSRGKVGMGDGLMIFAMGSVLNAGELIEILCLSFLLCGIYAGLQLGLLKKKRNTEIPFVPFLLVGYLGGILT